jgi:hypothetical protein
MLDLHQCFQILSSISDADWLFMGGDPTIRPEDMIMHSPITIPSYISVVELSSTSKPRLAI